MASLTIVSGSPGADKTTLAARLAQASQSGLHIPSDLFYTFPAHPIDPTRPESRTQNEAIIRALGQSAAIFAEAGYDVFVDGIVGPWFLPTLLSTIPQMMAVDYLLLTVAERTALERVRGREGHGLSGRVLATRAALDATDEYARHRFDTTELDPEAAYRALSTRLANAEFRLVR